MTAPSGRDALDGAAAHVADGEYAPADYTGCKQRCSKHADTLPPSCG